MLVLTRKTSERLQIMPSPELDRKMTVGELFANGPIEIVVTQVRGNQVKLGIQADKRLAILREELLDEVTREERAPASMVAVR